MNVDAIKHGKGEMIYLPEVKLPKIFKDEDHTESESLFRSVFGDRKFQYLKCRYCRREFFQASSRGPHEARCPALKTIPNNIHYLRSTLKAVRERLKSKGLTEGQAKYWSKIITEALES